MIRYEGSSMLTWLKRCTLMTHPPRKNAEPSTRSMLERMDPRSDIWTTRRRPPLSAKMATIISVALPKVAFIRPPTAENRVWGRVKAGYVHDGAAKALTAVRVALPKVAFIRLPTVERRVWRKVKRGYVH
jgi:hypothetical protein